MASGGTATGDTFYSIENLIGSDDRIDRFIGTSAANHFWGRGGGDYFNGGGGNDILDGGNDGDILYGEAGNDTIIGGAGQDYLDGGAGIDTVVYEGSSAGVTIDLANGTANGGDGDGPVQIVGRGRSTSFIVQETGTYYIVEGEWSDSAPGDGWVESVPEGSTYKLNVSVEFPPAPAQPGVAGADTLNGGGGSDLLDGGLAADTLTGGAGDDYFRFSTELGNGNIDWIKDFKVADDTILLDNLIFASVGGDGALVLGSFYKSAAGAAHDADDRIIYDTDSGILSYDADGSGQGAAVQFAHLNTNLDLSAADFIVI
ncbi:hypothetical protein NKJ78_01255 [Mesorhizobium sp. M0037]